MEQIVNYVKPELIVVASALYFVGMALKQAQAVKDKYIPLILAVQLSKVPKWVGMVNTAELNVRSWPGKENPTIKKYPYLAQHNLIDVCDTIKAADGSTWYYVRIVNKYYGFVAARYITRV